MADAKENVFSGGIMAAAFKKGFHALDACFYGIANTFFTTTEGIETGRQFLTFAVIGIMNTVIDFGLYYLLTRHTAFFDYRTPQRYLANAISFLIATSFSFWINRSWTFRRTGWPTLSELFRFYATTLGGLCVNSTILFFFSGIVGIEDLVAKIFSTVFNTVWNFIFKKLWVFVPATENCSAAR
jgi:putative flippase GtrA